MGFARHLKKKTKKTRFAALGTRVEAPQCLIRVIRLAASAPHTSQTALPYKIRRLIPLCKTTLSGQKFYSGTCARMSCLISAEVWLQSRGRYRNLLCVNGAGFAPDGRESNRGHDLCSFSGHTRSFSSPCEPSSAQGFGRSVGWSMHRRAS